ncbi:MAG: hypothetical protein MUQ00_17065 [Candidatus Aminicenantes bacterium]|nr:hypothetical protein [Candidatus Aminicenantes bacterium]
MKRFLLAAMIGVFVFSASPGPALSQQDPPHKSCCFLIYSTGVELGGLKSMAYFGRPSLALETQMVQLLFRISNWVEAANALCSDLSRAWDNYRTIQNEADILADSLTAPGSPSSSGEERAPSYSRIFYGLPAEKGELEFGLRDAGRRVTPPGREERTIIGFNCEVGYYLLGYYLGFAHHAFQVAQLEGEGSRWGSEARRVALEQIARAIDLVHSVRMTFEQGNQCGRLWLNDYAILSTLLEMDQERMRQQLTIAELVAKTGFVRYKIAAPEIFFFPPASECHGTPVVQTAKGNQAAAGWLRSQNGLNKQLADLQKKWTNKPQPVPTPQAPPQPLTAASLGDELTLSEYGYTGKFLRQGTSDAWTGSWTGGRPQTTFRLASGASMAIEGIAAGDVTIVLRREDHADYDLSPNLKAEYQLKATLQGTTIRLTGRRLIFDPGTKESQAWLKNNIAEVTGSAPLRK